MNNVLLLLCIIVIATTAFIYCKGDTYKHSEDFSLKDKEAANQALKELGDMLEAGDFPLEVSSEELMRYADNIYLAKVSSKEGLEYSPALNAKNWPYYYYSFPYNYKNGGAWPPGMFSRLNYWSPGFYTTGSGWSYYMRPGMGFKYWPRNRWIRHTQAGNNQYYYVTNAEDWTRNASNYADTPLRFHS